VVTAIGHEIDQSIADLVAHHSCKTPTAAAEFLVEKLELAAERVEAAAEQLRTEISRLLDQAARRVDLVPDLVRASRAALLVGETRFQRVASRFQSVVLDHLKDRNQRLTTLETRLAMAVRDRSAAARGKLREQELHLDNLAQGRLTAGRQQLREIKGRLAREAMRPLGQAGQKLENLGLQARLVDPERLLARGYTLTLDDRGKIITSAGQLTAGDRMQTRFVDGKINSIVQPEGSTGTAPAGKAAKRGGKKKQKNPGQETLFR
jgi:exodeoxyribonuclease VII large subunit